MSSLTMPTDRSEGFSIEDFAEQAVAQWSRLCQQFLDRQRSEILGKDPSAAQLEHHRSSLKWLLRVARAIYAIAADPDYPNPHVADELKGRLVQLEHSWRIVHERLSKSEGEQALREIFPE